MKKSILCEIAAVALATVGSIFLVTVYFPVLNPIQYQIETHQTAASFSRYLIGTPVALAILWAAWCFNREARRQK